MSLINNTGILNDLENVISKENINYGHHIFQTRLHVLQSQ